MKTDDTQTKEKDTLKAESDSVKRLVMPERLGKLKEGSEAWRLSLIECALNCCPTLANCDKCGRVLQYGYCCPTCGNDNPRGSIIDLEEYLA